MLNKLLLVGLLFLFSSNTWALNLSAQVDRTELTKNETLRLIIAVDETANQTIDLSQLEINFDIINQQRSQRQQIINGQASSLTQWILILAPKESGTLLIPSFRYKQVFSNPIEIIVSDNNTQSEASAAEDVILEVTVDKTSAYVQEQILLKTRLYYKIPLSSYDAPDLSLKDTTIRLVSEVTYRTTFNNERYQVLELIHALHPQTSGELTIPSFRWRLEKPPQGFFGRSSNPYVFVQSKPLSLSIKPIPAASTAQHWLPSTAVTVTPKLQQTAKETSVGEPLNFSLTISANGLSASQLPEINLPSSNHLQILQERSSVDDITSGKGIIGSRTSEFTLIPKIAGDIELPPVTLKWWNVTLNKEQEITLDTQTLFIADSVIQQDRLPDIALIDEPEKILEQPTVHSSFWQALVWLGVLLIACILFLFYRLNVAGKSTTTPLDGSVSLRKIEASIKDAIHKGELEKVRSLLILWGQKQFNDKNIRTTIQLAQKLPSIREDLTTLDKMIYGDLKNTPWQGQQILAMLKEKGVNKQREAEQEPLKPLYR